ncbi:hypothetical protein [Trujillonella endophytica]|uniref:Excreted virulence factor EspC, type VII ESX diderm n=1 Tax=Trujillonella endophytica TaxID=673521 RepID=A0A1H8WK02_9ACTN|nr:hypothetical protein [Trujillella endophytica]SEP27929.1 hypothetical protein SAMN05660991_04481 [Trujillella endophytica]
MSDSIVVQFETLEGLADELAALSAELASEADLCRSAVYTFGTAADGEVAGAAAQLGTGWAELVALLAEGTDAVAGSLRAAVRSYRLQEAQLSDRHLYVLGGVAAP